MYRLTGSVPLQDQDTGSLWILGIVLDDDRVPKALHDISNLDVIGCQFIVPVGRYPHRAFGREDSDPLKRSTQPGNIILKSDRVPLDRMTSGTG